MKKNSKYLLSLFAICLLTQSALSQKVGTTSMQFLKLMPCARATALGDAYVALATGAEAIFWNPGGVALIQGHELSCTYLSWMVDTRQGALAYAASLGDLGAAGIQMQYIDYGIMDETSRDSRYFANLDYPGYTGRQFRPYAYLVGLTYAKSLTDRFSTGVTVKYVYESLYGQLTKSAYSPRLDAVRDFNTYSNGFLFDFGLTYITGFRSVVIAVSVQNFGAELKYAEEKYPAPLLFRLGIAADLIGSNSLFLEQEDNRLTMEYDLFQPNDYTQQMHTGLEYEYARIIAIRVGYKYNYDNEGFTTGVGLHQTVGDIKLSFDYSFGSHTYLGNVHRISLGAGLQ